MAYKFCNQIYNHICYNRNYVASCTVGNNNKDKVLPIIVKNYSGEKIDWEKFFDERDKIREDAKRGIYPESCDGCQFFVEDEWDWQCHDRKFKYIQFSNYQKCNSNCIYCDNHIFAKFDDKKPDTFDFVPILKELIENGYVSEETEYDFAGGEPTIYYKFGELLDILNKTPVKSIIVHSNVIKYSKQLEEGIRLGKLNLCVSIDAGSKKVHEKVKQVKSFDTVWRNVKKYAKAKHPLKTNFISLKYIIIPGLNDSEEEILFFIKRALKAGVTKVILNADNNIFMKNNSEENKIQNCKRVVELSEFFVDICKKQNIKFALEYNIRHIYLSSGIHFPYFEY